MGGVAQPDWGGRMSYIHRTGFSISSFGSWKDETGKEILRVVDGYLKLGPWIVFKESVNLVGKQRTTSLI